MALPKINDVPRYEITIPSTNKVVRFRPYLVKEEKILLLALESQDEKLISNTILDIVEGCLDGKVNKKELTSFDVEYLFTQIRAKSVGETSKLYFYCTREECDEENEVTVDLSKVTINVNQTINKVALKDNVVIEQKYVPYFDIINSNILQSGSDVESLYKLIAKSIVAVCTDDEKINTKDEPVEDLYEFINNLTSLQYESLKQFVNNAPAIEQHVRFKCSKCGHDNSIHLKGIKDFF